MKRTRTTLLVLAAVMLMLVPVTAARPSADLQATLMKTDPIPVQAGDAAKLYLEVTNDGDTDAQNVTVQLLDSYPFRIKPDVQRTYHLGTVRSWEDYHINTQILVASDAPDGENEFKLRVSSNDFSKVLTVPVMVSNGVIDLSLANLKTSPSKLMPDTQDNQLSLDVVNNGEATAKNVVVNLNLPYGFEPVSSFSTRQALGNVGPGATKTATYRFDINTSAVKGPVSIPATIQYNRNGSTATTTKHTAFNVYLAGAPRYKLTNVQSDLSAGGKGTVRITVKNVGSEKSTSTRLRVMDNADLPFTYDSANAFVGTLEPGQEGTAVFDVSVDNDAYNKDYLVDFEVRGVKDTSVFVDDFTENIPVTVGAADSGGLSPTLIGIIGAAAALLIFAGYWYVRNKGVPGQDESE